MNGTGLVAQHYVYEMAEKAHRHMDSISDVLTPAGWTTAPKTGPASHQEPFERRAHA